VRRVALAAGSLFAAVVVTAAAPAAPPPPAVSISTMQPLVVTGAYFFPREWVRVTVNTSTARVHANRLGRFRVTFPSLTLGKCGGLVIRAAGTHGTLAGKKLPLLACMPVREP
jgi:hypothetical protein